MNDHFSIEPLFDGSKCIFSINPSLPEGLLLNEKTGEISGKIEKEMEKKDYTVECKNSKNKMEFKLTLEFIVKFTELNKFGQSELSQNGKIITNRSNGREHCYLNLKMTNGIYRIKYKLQRNRSDCTCSWYIGLSTTNTYSGDSIHSQSNTCNICIGKNETKDCSSYCHIGNIVTSNPEFRNNIDCIYEITVDMNKKEFWVSKDNSKPVLIVKDLPSPLYNYVTFDCKNNTYEILSFFHTE